MCGVCGVIGIHDNEVINQMVKKLSHRGPDDHGIWGEGTISLGHTRLSIIDISPTGHQPMTNEDGSLWIVFNGEIYNFLELKKDLIKRGHHFKSSTDTEIIVHLYEEFGEDCVSKLRGMFAFAIWDKKQNKLFAARDHLGIKPFYYSFTNGVFIFASEVRAILSSGLINKKINLDATYDYFLYGSVQSPASLVEGISQLPAGCYLTFHQGELFIKHFWELGSADPFIDEADPAQCANNVVQLLEESVKGQLMSDVPLGVFLSGGIDSSILTLLAQWNSPQPINTFSVVFEEQAYNEDRYSSLISAAFGTHHTRIPITKNEILNDIPAILDAMDQPSCDGFNTFIVSKAVQKAGIKVALSGVGADELLGGYNHFTQLPRLQKINQAFKLIPSSIRKILSRLFIKILKNKSAQKSVLSISACNDLVELYLLKRKIFLDHSIPLNTNNNSNRHQQLTERLSRLKNTNIDPINTISFLEINHYLQNTLLADTDAMSMANSLEVRPPFLDHQFVEKIFQLSGELKRNQPFPKALILHPLKNVLPAKIYERRKQGFVLPFEKWLREGELKKYCEETFAFAKNIPFLDSKKIDTIWQQYLNNSKEYNYSNILTLLSFIHWYKKNIQA